jgi:3-deoxy-D-manno-octulosonate 8-phosphate phosphatase (KDO 8-P phosphatase)
MPASPTARARQVQLLVMDVDGVLTDGRMILSDQGGELKSFFVRDGIGLDLARRAGIKLALVTGESSTIARARGAKLGVDRVVLGARRKGETVESLMAEHGLGCDAVAYIGDDLLDIPALQRVGLAVAVADAAPEVKSAAHVVTRAPGGHGAVRECVELILRAQGRWQSVVDAFVREHGGLPQVPRRVATRRRRGERP